MTTTAATGFSDASDSKQAGIDAAKQAMRGLQRCDFAMLFSTSKHDPRHLRDGVRSVIGADAKLVGGYAVGVITNDRLGYGGHEVGVICFQSDTMQTDLFIEGGLKENEFETGARLAKQIMAKDFRGEPSLLFMYDSIKQTADQGLLLNGGTNLVRGMESVLGTFPRGAGVGCIGDMQWNPTYQWFGDQIERQSAIAAAISGGVKIDTIIMHGCQPVGDYHTITKADGCTVLEIDGKPALDAVAEWLGPGSDKTWEDYPLFITLGVNRGDKYGDFDDELYQNRLCIWIDKARRGMVMLEPDLTEGTEVQLMRRAIDMEYMQTRTKELLSRVAPRKPIAALYINCAGRAKAYGGTDREDAEEIQKALGPGIPLLGMYSGVEIAKVGAKMQPLDWTGVLCLFSE